MNASGRPEYSMTVCCGDTEFIFPLKEKEDAWYSLDHAVSSNESGTLEINADRDVYAVYTDSSGIKHYGTIGDGDDKLLADNYSVCDKERYIFYEDPRAREYYI